MAEVTVGLTDQQLDPGAAIATVTDDSCGAVASFVGTVRVSAAADTEAEVTSLYYEAHTELAEEVLREICDEAAGRWGLVKVVALHRVGECALGEPTVVIAVSAPHRAQALEACHWIIDSTKQRVPIFKKEHYADGATWIGSGS